MSRVTDPISNLQTLIRCPSVTPEEGGALAALEALLAPLGFDVDRPTFSEDGTPDVENLFARLGSEGPHLTFAGHTDVVPVGDAAAWTHDPFAGEIVGGELFGRGAVDMKGGIACFAAAVARLIEDGGAPEGSVSFLITGDEEGPAINGTVKLLQWADKAGHRFDAALVGEPTNPDALGDMIKIGRRGSVSGTVVVNGTQGHVAYPHRADNPLRGLLTLTRALLHPDLDQGSDDFQPSNLEVASIDTGNPAFNVIPARASANFNIRFNDLWDSDSIRNEVENRLARAAGDETLRQNAQRPIDYELIWVDRPSPVFLTRNDKLVDTLTGAVEQVTGRRPELSTSGGTSDARFIKDYCPVVEFGLVGQTMHMVDERVRVDDLETLTEIYLRFLRGWFAQSLS